MSDHVIDTKAFQARLKSLLAYWKTNQNEPEKGFNSVQAIYFINDAPDENKPYSKTSTLQTWLFGYEFPNTLVALTFDKLMLVTSVSKAKYLSALQDLKSPIEVEIVTFSKDEADKMKALSRATDLLKENSTGPIGTFIKDKKQGKFITQWKNTVDKNKLVIEEVDVSLGVALAIAVKDEAELKLMKAAAKASAQVLKHHLFNELTSVIDEERKITHEMLADKTEDMLLNKKKHDKIKLPSDIDPGCLDWSYTPIIQSGGAFDLKPSAFSDNKELTSGVIICSLGVRYKNYCSNIGRTLLIDVTQTQERNYSLLLELQRHILTKIKPGVPFSQLYSAALKFITENRPELESHFTKNIGFVTGIEFRESGLTLQPKSIHKLQENMVICLSLGFQNLTEKTTGKKYSLLLIDTVRVLADGALVLTDALRELTDATYQIKNDKEPTKKTKAEAPKKAAPVQTAILKSKFRSEDQEETPEQKRREHQRELFLAKQEEGIRRFKGEGEAFKSANQESFKHFESYKRETGFPKEAKSLGIVVDQRGESIIVPINGLAVPFHISTLKNASKNDEGEYVYLRLNFLTPGQGVAKKEDMPFPDPNAHFLRALTFRSSDTFRLTEIYKRILDLKKEIAKKEIEKKDMADLIQQDKLRLSDGRVSRLSDIFVRPPPEGKRMAGELEIHTNGLRYKHPRANQNIDVLFSNIKHLFFQPCENELLVLIHVHLNDPIMIGKKKTRDIQFFREASDVSFDETGNRRRQGLYGDEDEIGAEMEERRHIKLLNDEFKQYASKIAEAARGKLEVETPFRDIGFQGVPARSNVLLMPTGDCLVHLSDPPFLIITLAEVEIVHMERVQFGLKNFDLVFIFKDFSKTPVHINTIPMKQLDGVKEWLDSMDVVFTEGPVNLNWNAIMKTIKEDPVLFFEDGGWSFLDEKAEDSGEPSEDSASEFEIDSEELVEDSDESDYSEEGSAASDGSAGSAASEEDDEEEEADDWDDLEAKATRDDQKRKAPESAARPVIKKRR
ncbi:FACT complex subunit spt16 [Entomophthora muscae]|uniref:FACT complex subunit spt16 n=1 Tax=Entomophthora muscae TaxID=34485 RepID=A0ACC2SWR0_9FUNG|nr:FACT complex subunit spt16 [Entomophthora muscae]